MQTHAPVVHYIVSWLLRHLINLPTLLPARIQHCRFHLPRLVDHVGLILPGMPRPGVATACANQNDRNTGYQSDPLHIHLLPDDRVQHLCRTNRQPVCRVADSGMLLGPCGSVPAGLHPDRFFARILQNAARKRIARLLAFFHDRTVHPWQQPVIIMHTPSVQSRHPQRIACQLPLQRNKRPDATKAVLTERFDTGISCKIGIDAVVLLRMNAA